MTPESVDTRWEIERKAPVLDGHADALLLLLEEALGPSKLVVKHDRYYVERDAVLESVADIDRATWVRLRSLDDGTVMVTGKSRATHDGNELNREWEFRSIDGFDPISAFFVEYLGFRLAMEKHKSSRLIRLGVATIELCEVEGLGIFFEAELFARPTSLLSLSPALATLAGANPGQEWLPEEWLESLFAQLSEHLGDAEPRLYLELLAAKRADTK